MQGKIIKGIAGFYYVHVVHSGIYECKAKGIFRNQKIKPLVGDNVEITVLDEENRLGNITDILTRTNALVRPAVANIDQALVVFAVTKPTPNFNLLDRFLISMEQQGISTIICFNKMDLITEDELKELGDPYRRAGYQILEASAKKKQGIQEINELIQGKTTVLAGPSGVGKSSMLNALKPEANVETGAISEKIQRGKHTTRHSEIINIKDGTYIMDTPGFSSMYLMNCDKDELKDYFPEFREYEGTCRFQGCVHIHEPGCSVKQALQEDELSRIRYENYLVFYEELKNQKKY